MDFHKCLIVFILWNSIYIVTSEFKCRSSDICFCTTIRTYYEFQCPLEDSNIVVKVFPNYGISVQCLKDISWSDQQLPQLDFGNAESIMFRTCPMPDNIVEVMNNFGIKKVKEFQFDFSSVFENTTLTSKYFDGLNYLEKLILNNNKIRSIDENAFKFLGNLTEIDLSSNTLSIKPNMFQYSTELALLDLSQNNLNYLPDELFQNLTKLKTLYLWSNNFTTLRASVFEHLHHLRTLELSNSYIKYLPEDTFYSLKDLSAINLAMNELSYIPSNLFSKNTNLEIIKMQRNRFLKSLPDALFSNLPHLRSVELYECKLSNLPENLFYESERVENISFRHNQLTELPENIFKGLTQLQNLDLSYNNIQNLPENVFYSLSKLKTLKLNSNKLVHIGPRLFFSLLKLELVNLSNNQLISLHKYSFQRLVMLKEVILSHNYLDLTENVTNVSPFSSNLDLEKVDLSYNNITCISEDWMFSKVRLRELDFSYNKIEHLNFNYLVVVSHQLVINLAYNKIKTVNFTDAELLARSQGNLDAFSSNGANTVVLLEGNPIHCDCNIYDFARYFDRTIDPMVPTLVTVKADDVTCHSPSNFVGYFVKNLKPQMLTCRLDQLEEGAKCPKNCACLIRPWNKAFIVSCKNQNFTKVPEITLPKRNIFNQTEVYLQGNLITVGPSVNMGYENVTVLELSSNRLNEFSWVPPKLKLLSLDNNNISFLNYDVLEMLNTSTLTNISLGNNPWSCDCQSVNFSNFLVTHLPHQQIDVNNIKCSNNGELLVQLNINELCPNYTTFAIVLCVSVAILALMTAFITIFYYRFELEIKVWLYAHNMCLFCIGEKEIDRNKEFDAFVSYSHKDEDFVVADLVPMLEKGPRPYKLCLHIRDWKVGEFISKQIVESVEKSRRTIILLSPSFLKSVWAKMEFTTAHRQAMADGRARVIIIIYGDVDLEKDLDDELKAYIKTNTYVKWGDPWFWDKLRYAMPHTKIKMGRRAQNIMININDKLDLINGIPTTPNSGTTPPVIDMEPPLLLKDHPLNFQNKEMNTPVEAGLKPLLITMNH